MRLVRGWVHAEQRAELDHEALRGGEFGGGDAAPFGDEGAGGGGGSAVGFAVGVGFCGRCARRWGVFHGRDDRRRSVSGWAVAGERSELVKADILRAGSVCQTGNGIAADGLIGQLVQHGFE